MLPTRSARILAVVILMAFVAACHDATAPVSPPVAAGAALIQLPRALSPQEVSEVGAANAFSFALWSKINTAQPDTNVFISPLSASFAFGMAMNGAATMTYDQMHAALQFGAMSLTDINAGYKSLIPLLESLDPSVQMQIANSIWYNRIYPVQQAFLDTTKADFGATVSGFDSVNTAAAVAAINAWVNTTTNGKIPAVLQSIDPTDAMFLLNAIYFKGSWRAQFDPKLTASASFTTTSGATEPMQLMHRTDGMLYAETPTYQAVDLSYGDSAFAMTVILPKNTASVETVAASLNSAAWQALLNSLHTDSVALSLPRVQLSYERILNSDLTGLGMTQLFDCNFGADLSNMFLPPYGNSFCVHFAQQNSFVNINEEGTEAAAVTVISVGILTAQQLGPVPVLVDHPYVLVIHDRLTGTVLFMGKIAHIPQ